MRAVRADGNGGVAVVQVEVAPPEGMVDPVRVRVAACGICGSDHQLARWNLPATLGHEFAGFLDDGTAVTVRPDVWCGECERCLAGESELCTVADKLMHGVNIDGGLGEVVWADPRRRAAARGRPAGRRRFGGAVVGRPAAVNRIDPATAGRICVIGGAAIGLAAAAALRATSRSTSRPATRTSGRRPRSWARSRRER
ncbi:MAG: alcohol dehydrogenase catalytic domain-containing protein [Acidimicrobiia bacterium]